MGFQWDPDKARSNLLRHRVDFADAVGVLEDPNALTVEDPGGGKEQRFVTLGLDLLGRLLVVVYTYRGEDIRLISARKASRQEMDTYGKRI